MFVSFCSSLLPEREQGLHFVRCLKECLIHSSYTVCIVDELINSRGPWEIQPLPPVGLRAPLRGISQLPGGWAYRKAFLRAGGCPTADGVSHPGTHQGTPPGYTRSVPCPPLSKFEPPCPPGENNPKCARGGRDTPVNRDARLWHLNGVPPWLESWCPGPPKNQLCRSSSPPSPTQTHSKGLQGPLSPSWAHRSLGLLEK